MLEVEGNSATGITAFPTRPYLPNFPPSKGLKSSYSRSALHAPFYALNGFESDVKAILIEKINLPVQSYRNRSQVGSTNRWRLPAFLGSDLLGTSQALKAVGTSCSETIRNVKTADSRYGSSTGTDLGLWDMMNNPVSKRQRWMTSDTPSLLHNKNMHVNQPRSIALRRSSSQEQRTPLCFSARRSAEREAKTEPSRISLSNLPKRHSTNKPWPTPTPIEKFILQFQRVAVTTPPDVLLHALNTKWYLHSQYISDSKLINSLYEEKVNNFRLSAGADEPGETPEFAPDSEVGVSISIPRFSSSCLLKENVIHIRVPISDPLISKQAFAVALLSLYEENTEIEATSILEVAAATTLLEMPLLKARCCSIMKEIISPKNVCAYYEFSLQYEFPELTTVCENWMELNLVPFMLNELSLADVPKLLLEKTLKSPRLFVFDEYSVYKVLCHWIFLKQQSTVKARPTWETIATWFMSIPKGSSFLSTSDGQEYSRLFCALRLNGITDPSHLDEVQKMSIVPLTRMLRVFSDHYYALQGGGDMSLLARFESGAVRYGFLLNEKSGCYSKIIALHGFYFELIASVNERGILHIFFKRLKPSDSMLPFRVCERQTFSMRQDREVRYSITIQWIENQENHSKTIGPMAQCFGFGSRTAESQKLKLPRPSGLLYITYHMLLPPS